MSNNLPASNPKLYRTVVHLDSYGDFLKKYANPWNPDLYTVDFMTIGGKSVRNKNGPIEVDLNQLAWEYVFHKLRADCIEFGLNTPKLVIMPSNRDDFSITASTSLKEEIITGMTVVCRLTHNSSWFSDQMLALDSLRSVINIRFRMTEEEKTAYVMNSSKYPPDIYFMYP